MEKIITGVEFAILVAIVVAIAILLHIMEARRIMAKDDNPAQDADRQHEDESPTRSFREALAHYNDTEHEQPCASMEPMCGSAQAEADRQARSREAVKRAQAAAFHAQRMYVQKLEREYQAEKTQHNSSFRALGMTPVRTYPEAGMIVAFDPVTQKHVLVRDSWGERK